MCGIVGFVFSDYNQSHLKKMTNTLKHRGPDAQDIFYKENPNIGLGHTRLSVIDLSPESNQPMYSHCDRYVLVFNGEIYNYKEIRNKLNVNWKTNSDTEVILQAFISYGKDFVNHLNGMFSIAIWDKELKELNLFRDRLGIKPLFYFFDGEKFVFASEIKAFKVLKMPLSINKKAVYNYFNFGFSPQKETIYNEIKQLDAACYGVLTNGVFEINKYWKLDSNIKNNPSLNFKQAQSDLDNLLQKSVEYRLISDVGIGTFLSGGTDSSLITAIASKQSSTKVNTFSIGFKEAKYNESIQAKEIANYLKTNHNEFIVSYTDAIDNLEKVMDNFDQPFVDSSALPTYLISKLAKEHVTVSLSGDGGDELFMGYGSYNWGERLNKPFNWHSRKLIAYILSLSNSNRNNRASLVFNASNKSNLVEHIFSQEQYLFSVKELDKLLLCDEKYLENNFAKKYSFKMNQTLFEINNYLKEDLLVKVDRASMLNGLEVRVPLLDHNIVEFALSLPDKFKMTGGVQKHILKQVLYQYVPKQLLDYPKWGFSIPLQYWLKNEIYYLIEKYLDDKLIEDQQIFNLNYVKELKLRFLNGEDYLYNRLWQLIVFNKFYYNTDATW